MKQRALFLIAGAAILSSVGISNTQPAFDGEFSPRERLRGNFESRAPALDERVPKINAFDRDGNRFDLVERLKGKYTVLVFGCLT